MQSHFFENSVAEVLDAMDAMGQYSDLRLRKALKNSSMLSSDVSAGYDPAFAEAFEKKELCVSWKRYRSQQVYRCPWKIRLQ